MPTLEESLLSPQSSLQETEILQDEPSEDYDLTNGPTFYLDYLQTDMSYHHYILSLDSQGFVHDFLVNSALKDRALLYAVCAFAAYQYSIANMDNWNDDCFIFYDKAVIQLRQEFEQKPAGTIYTLLTGLQLALLDEYNGAWDSVLSHCKAAHATLTSIFTPQSISSDPHFNKILELYVRFDQCAAFRSGENTLLSREWFYCQHEHFIRLIADPATKDSVDVHYEERNAYLRLLAKDMSVALAKKASGANDDLFDVEVACLEQKFCDWCLGLNSAMLNTTRFRFDDWEEWNKKGLTITPEYTYAVAGDRQPTNYMLANFWSLQLVLNGPLRRRSGRSTEQRSEAINEAILKLFQAVEDNSDAPSAVLNMSDALGAALWFRGEDSNLDLWCRQKRALVEERGYFMVSAFRNIAADTFNIRDQDNRESTACLVVPESLKMMRRVYRDRTAAAKAPDKSGEIT